MKPSLFVPFEDLRRFTEHDIPCPWDETAVEAAVKMQNTELLVCLRSQNPPCPWGVSATVAAVELKILEILSVDWQSDFSCCG